MTAAAGGLAVLALLLAPQARAAGPAEGAPSARAEAEFRLPGAELVEIEGFASPAGDIPCGKRSFSNSWHYKFHAAGDWLTINACADSVLNAAKHLPYSKTEEPRTKLASAYASPGEVLKKLAEDGNFSPVPNPLDRDILMRVRNLPAKDGRPAGCYWFVSQGKAKALADCAAEQTWNLAKAGPAAAGAGGTGPLVKGKDTAGRYLQAALDTMHKKTPGARLMMIEALVDKTGSTKCVDPKDGWSYVFASRTAPSAFGGCAGKTAAEFVLFDGRSAGSMANMDPITPPFKDSDLALSRVPAPCRKNYSTISMKLRNFKPAAAPVAGHSLTWTIDCGSLRYYVDGHTGSYLGPGKK